MLLGDDLARLRCESAADFAAPCAVFESLARPSCLLDGRNILPVLVIVWAVPMMQSIENAELRPPRRRGPGRRAYLTWVRFSPLRLSVWKLSRSCNESPRQRV